MCSWGQLPGHSQGLPAASSPGGKGQRSFWSLSYRESNPIRKGSAFVTPQKSRHLPHHPGGGGVGATDVGAAANCKRHVYGNMCILLQGCIFPVPWCLVTLSEKARPAGKCSALGGPRSRTTWWRGLLRSRLFPCQAAHAVFCCRVCLTALQAPSCAHPPLHLRPLCRLSLLSPDPEKTARALSDPPELDR